MSTKIRVKGFVTVDDANTWEDALKMWPELKHMFSWDYGVHLELDDKQVHADGAVVMLVDPDGEIGDEGPATVDGYQGCGGYTVTIPEEHRTDPDDVDGLREVDESQMVPADLYKELKR